MQLPPLGIVLETLIKLSIGSKRVFVVHERVVNLGGSSELLLCARSFLKQSTLWGVKQALGLLEGFSNGG